MEPKKISFGFSKLVKKTNIISNNVIQEENKVELIECLEGQSIKVKDAVEEVKQLLVIPIKDNQKNLLDRIRDAKNQAKPSEEKKNESEDNRPDSELSADELAARLLMKEAKDRLARRNNTNESRVTFLPLNQEAQSLEGEKEPTLEDYESVPISDYGLALLRGMGWQEGMTIGKNTSKTVSVSVPELRPKGLGLGATKVVQSEIPTKKPVDQDGKELTLIKGAYAKIIAGINKGNYCEVLGFDEEGGRVIVNIYPKGENVNVNEYMLVPVTKEEFSKGSKILNNAKYEEYLEISEKKLERYKIKEENSKLDSVKEEYSHNSDLDSENYNTNNTKIKKYNNSCSDERDSRVGQRNERKRSDSSDYEGEKRSERRTKTKYRDRSRSRSESRNTKKKHKNRRSSNDESYKKDRKNRRRSDSSSDDEYYEKDKKSSKHTKSKYKDRSRDESKSRDKHKKEKKQKGKHRKDSDSSESDHKRDKRKKNKCKSRHRRNSSSSSPERSHKTKK